MSFEIASVRMMHDLPKMVNFLRIQDQKSFLMESNAFSKSKNCNIAPKFSDSQYSKISSIYLAISPMYRPFM